MPNEKIKDIHSVLSSVNGGVVHDGLDHKRKKYWHRGGGATIDSAGKSNVLVH